MKQLLLRVQGKWNEALGMTLFRHAVRTGPCCFLESLGPVSESSRYVLLAWRPRASFDSMTVPYGSLWRWLAEVGREQKERISFLGALQQAWFGAIAYECADVHPPPGEKPLSPRREKTEPLFYFFRPGSLFVADRLKKRWWGFSDSNEIFLLPFLEPRSFSIQNLHPLQEQSEYERKVEWILEKIADGEIYQANLSHRFEGIFEGDPAALYERLREFNPGPFCGFLSGPFGSILSSSPERLVACRGIHLEARPIAGTRPRGARKRRDIRLIQELLKDEKERAEHVMLVDLARNDLGRVAENRTVEVQELFRVETYSRVHHLVSVVKARRKSGVDAAQITAALFPGGTITGCPKRRCREILREVEDHPRGWYTGALGYVAPGPLLDWNILIRTLSVDQGGTLSFHVGAGIVADSRPKREYAETLHKGEALAEALGVTLTGKTHRKNISPVFCG